MSEDGITVEKGERIFIHFLALLSNKNIAENFITFGWNNLLMK